jgi:hypothetical protein
MFFGYFCRCILRSSSRSIEFIRNDSRPESLLLSFFHRNTKKHHKIFNIWLAIDMIKNYLRKIYIYSFVERNLLYLLRYNSIWFIGLLTCSFICNGKKGRPNFLYDAISRVSRRLSINFLLKQKNVQDLIQCFHIVA